MYILDRYIQRSPDACRRCRVAQELYRPAAAVFEFPLPGRWGREEAVFEASSEVSMD